MPLSPTPNMGLVYPQVAGDSGVWGTILNTLFDVVDPHDHSSGKGVPIKPSGMLINADLPFGGNNLTTLRSLRFQNQGAALSNPSDVGILYERSNDLWWVSGGGLAVQLTSGGTINAAGLTNSIWTTANVTVDTVIAPASTVTRYLVNTTGSRTITLPSASSVPGRFYVVEDFTGSGATNPITIARTGSDTIDGVAGNFTVFGARASVLVVSDGVSAWTVLRTANMKLLNNATVPPASTVGNVLQVSAANVLSYGPVNLGGGVDCVTGVLPSANMATASAGSTGTVQLAGDLAGTGTSYSAPRVSGITGASGKAPIGCQVLEWPNTVSTPFFGLAQRVAAGNATTLTVYGQDATSGNGNGGTLSLVAGDWSGLAEMGRITFETGGLATHRQIVMQIADPNWLTAPVVAIGVPTALSTTEMPSGTGGRLLYLANCSPVPSVNPVNGCTVFSDGGNFGFRTAGGNTNTEFEGFLYAGPPGGSITNYMRVNMNGVWYRIPLYS